MSVKVELNLSRLRRVIKGEPAALDRAARNCAGAVRDLAKQLCPVDTGALRASIHVRREGREAVYSIVAPLDYAGYVEYGTHKMEAQPYLTPAIRHIDPLPYFQKEIGALLK